MLRRWFLVYDDSGDDGGNGEGGNNTPVIPKSLTDYLKTNPAAQEELNNMMATNRKKLTTQNQTLIQQLEELKDQTNITTQQKTELEERIEQLSNQYLTKEELTKKEQQKLSQKFQKDLEKATTESESWRDRYTQSRIQRELLDSAVTAKAINPDILVDMLSGKTYLGQKLGDNGQPTGEFEVKIKFQDSDESGNPITVELSPEATVKRMQELPNKYGNLFQTTATGGMGASSGMGGSRSQPALQSILKDPVAYAKWRKENPDLDISKLVR